MVARPSETLSGVVPYGFNSTFWRSQNGLRSATVRLKSWTCIIFSKFFSPSAADDARASRPWPVVPRRDVARGRDERARGPRRAVGLGEFSNLARAHAPAVDEVWRANRRSQPPSLGCVGSASPSQFQRTQGRAAPIDGGLGTDFRNCRRARSVMSSGHVVWLADRRSQPSSERSVGSASPSRFQRTQRTARASDGRKCAPRSARTRRTRQRLE